MTAAHKMTDDEWSSLISAARKIAADKIAGEFLGGQPMTGQTGMVGHIFTMGARFGVGIVVGSASPPSGLQ